MFGYLGNSASFPQILLGHGSAGKLVLPGWACGSSAQVNSGAGKSGKSYVIGFYNLENLFDTYHDEGKNDYEYLPDGANQWTEAKYVKKQQNMAKVIAAMK